ncbi:hypothetical protein GOP47_0021032 [Adiantum capillus-veneris]|uniref:Uncharacterized protein n=1 Tax=Adiantum capillus-veneris TaxID=13818 RepID=A0A9D4UB37_ADICA|nr:hypothetical protein GOP47_0021032 [Adiantum capillus-veneris]
MVKIQFVGVLHNVKYLEFTGSIELFTTLVFLSKEDTFEGLTSSSNPGTKSIILDAGHLDLDFGSVSQLSDVEFLQLKKESTIKQCIQKYCKEDLKIIDMFSDGYITELGLKQKREVLCLVGNIEDQRKLKTRLLSFSNQHDGVKTWAKLQSDQLDHPIDDQGVSNMVGSSTSETPISIIDFFNLEASMS